MLTGTQTHSPHTVTVVAQLIFSLVLMEGVNVFYRMVSHPESEVI